MSRLRRLIAFDPPDPVGFWGDRAGDAGWRSVMWANPAYNVLADRDQWRAIERWLPAQRAAVLDLGCGTGRMSPRLAARFTRYLGVDIPPMVDEARRRCPELAECFVAATVQDYAFPREAFDLVLSMACVASACRASELDAVAARMVAAARPGGRVVLIDPFHTWAPLVRTCRLRASEVVRRLEGHGTTLVEWGGLHCAPFRLLLAGSAFSKAPALTRAGYALGEALCRRAPRLLGDYCVIVVRKAA